MTTPSVESQRKKIYRGVFILLSMVIVIFASVLVVVQVQNNETHKRDAVVNDYHLTISEKSLELLAEINTAVLWFQRYGIEHKNNKAAIEYESHVSPIKSGLSERDKLNRFKYDIEKLVGEISSIQLQYADPEFSSVSFYLEEAHRKVQKSLTEIQLSNDSAGEVIAVIVEPMISSTHQLQRLHQHAYQNARQSLTEFQEKSRSQIISLIIILTLLGFFAVIRMLSHLRLTLKGLTQAQKELREREQNFSSLTSNIHEGVLVNFEGKQVFANQSMARMLGYEKAEDLIGTSITDLVHPDELKKVSSRLHSRLQGDNEESQYETIFLSRKSEPVYVEVNAATTMWHGKPAGMVTVSNITDRSQTEKDLRQFKRTLDQTLDCVFMFDAEDLVFIYVNEGGLQQVGYSHDEILSMHPYDIKPEISEQKFRDMIIPLFNGALSSLSFETIHKHKSGHLIPVEIILQYITPVGEAARFIAIVRDISERNAAIDEIRATSRLLDGIVENVPNMIFLKRAADLSFEFLNKAGETLLGLDRAELLGKNDYDFFPKVQADFFTEKDRSALELQGILDIPEETIETSKGGRILHTKKITLRDEHGSPEYLLGISDDITERKQAEQLLLENEKRLKAAQHSAKMGSWDLDLMTNSLIWSDEIYRIFEIDKTLFDASYEAFIEAVHPDDRGIVKNAYTESLNNRLPYEIRHRLQMKDGRIKHVVETCESYFDNDGNALRSIGTVQDISDLIKAEIEIEQNRIRFEAMIQSIPDAIVYADPERKIRMINDATIRMFGYAEAELFGHQTKMLYASPDDFYQQGNKRYNQKSNEANRPYEVAYKRKNGQEFVGETLGTPVRYLNGELLGYLGVIRDVTERKEVEAELTKHREHLEDLVQERTAEMKAARDIAEHANEAKSEFLSRMSHELRTPMNAILGFGQLLEFSSSKLDENQQVHVSEILGAGHHLLALINDVLDLAKIESGKLEVGVEKVAIDDLLEQSLALIAVQAGARYLQIVDNASGKGYWVQADFTRLKQALINLLSNAMKYNKEHGSITINSEVVNKQRLRISITDAGPGLTEAQVELLFQPFERLNAGSNIEGAGIGLTITKNLIELMDGQIGVNCTPGDGCTFWVELALSNPHI